MPWSYPDNVPSSMKYLKPSIQKKAISISNHILENTNDEGKAIAIGISKAKSVHDKKASLVKLAAINFKQIIRPLQRNKATVIKPALFGAAMGAIIGNDRSYKHDIYGYTKLDKNMKRVKKDGVNPLKRTLIGATIGGTIGGGLGSLSSKTKDKFKLKFSKIERDFNNEYHKRTNRPKDSWKDSHDYTSGKKWQQEQEKWRQSWYGNWQHQSSDYDHSAFFKEHGVDHNTLKTKKEATKVFYKASAKVHPDVNPGIDPNKMEKLNSNWEKVKKTQWFEKLAMIIKGSNMNLIKLANNSPGPFQRGGKPLKDDVVRTRVFNKKMRGKDPESFMDLLKANKEAEKTTGRYKKIVKTIRTKNVGRIVRAVSLGAMLGAATFKYAKKIGKKKKDESNKTSN